jgi:lipopolysaccharide export system protein LptC
LCCAWLYITSHIAQTTAPKKHNSSQSSSISIKNLLLHEQGGIKNFNLVIHAKDTHIDHSSDSIVCTTISCTIHHHSKPIAHIKAQHAFLNKLKQSLLVHKSVSGEWHDITLQGQELLYDYALQQITSLQPIVLRHKFFTLHANKSTVNLATHTLELDQGVYSEIFITREHQQQQ